MEGTARWYSQATSSSTSSRTSGKENDDSPCLQGRAGDDWRDRWIQERRAWNSCALLVAQSQKHR